MRGNATGTYIRTIGKSTGAVCRPKRWWDATTVTAACTKSGAYLDQDVYRVPLSVAAATQVTRQPSDMPGHDWAQRTPSGKVVVKQVQLCGPAAFGLLTGTGTFTPIGLGSRNPNLIGVSGNTMVIESTPGCGVPGASTLLTQDVRTGGRRWLGGMASAVVIDPRS
ncbi:hypothetical protein [Nostocoides australiense]